MKNKNMFLFNKFNYVLLIISIVIISIGFILMIGGGGTTDFDFNKEIFSSRRIVVVIIDTLPGFAIFYND